MGTLLLLFQGSLLVLVSLTMIAAQSSRNDAATIKSFHSATDFALTAEWGI